MADGGMLEETRKWACWGEVSSSLTDLGDTVLTSCSATWSLTQPASPPRPLFLVSHCPTTPPVKRRMCSKSASSILLGAPSVLSPSCPRRIRRWTSIHRAQHPSIFSLHADAVERHAPRWGRVLSASSLPSRLGIGRRHFPRGSRSCPSSRRHANASCGRADLPQRRAVATQRRGHFAALVTRYNASRAGELCPPAQASSPPAVTSPSRTSPPAIAWTSRIPCEWVECLAAAARRRCVYGVSWFSLLRRCVILTFETLSSQTSPTRFLRSATRWRLRRHVAVARPVCSSLHRHLHQPSAGSWRHRFPVVDTASPLRLESVLKRARLFEDGLQAGCGKTCIEKRSCASLLELLIGTRRQWNDRAGRRRRRNDRAGRRRHWNDRAAGRLACAPHRWNDRCR